MLHATEKHCVHDYANTGIQVWPQQVNLTKYRKYKFPAFLPTPKHCLAEGHKYPEEEDCSLHLE